MHVLLVSQYFFPEVFKSNDIAFELAKKGYQVTVLTGIPNYPTGSYFKGYGIFKKRKEIIDGVKVIRAPLIPRGKGNGFQVVINYFSWLFFASITAVFMGLFNKFDVIIVHASSPILQSIPAIVVKKMRKIPILLWVLDLWPESMGASGGLNNKWILNLFNKVVIKIYDNADKILIASRKFEDAIKEKGDYSEKLIYFPNWAESIFCDCVNENSTEIPSGFIVMFAGNIGEAQDFESIMQASLLLKDEIDIKFVFIGDGRKKKWVEDFIEKHNMSDTVITLGYFPINRMPSFFKKANIMLVSLKNELIYEYTVPAKIQAYMASGKPIVAMVTGESQSIISNANCGLSVNAGDHEGLSRIIQEMRDMTTEKRDALGANGIKYYYENFHAVNCIHNLCKMIEEYRANNTQDKNNN